MALNHLQHRDRQTQNSRAGQLRSLCLTRRCMLWVWQMFNSNFDWSSQDNCSNRFFGNLVIRLRPTYNTFHYLCLYFILNREVQHTTYFWYLKHVIYLHSCVILAGNIIFIPRSSTSLQCQSFFKVLMCLSSNVSKFYFRCVFEAEPTYMTENTVRDIFVVIFMQIMYILRETPYCINCYTIQSVVLFSYVRYCFQ